MYNMTIGLIVEYTSIGELFENVIHGSRILIIILIDNFLNP